MRLFSFFFFSYLAKMHTNLMLLVLKAEMWNKGNDGKSKWETEFCSFYHLRFLKGVDLNHYHCFIQQQGKMETWVSACLTPRRLPSYK